MAANMRDDNSLGEARLGAFLIFANAVASICVHKRGGIPAMADRDAGTGFFAGSIF